jgi:hypothetical protein
VSGGAGGGFLVAMVTDLRRCSVAMLLKTVDGRNLYSRLRSFEIMNKRQTNYTGRNKRRHGEQYELAKIWG